MGNIGGKYFNSEENIYVDALEEELEENLIVNSKRRRTDSGAAIVPPVAAQSDDQFSPASTEVMSESFSSEMNTLSSAMSKTSLISESSSRRLGYTCLNNQASI